MQSRDKPPPLFNHTPISLIHIIEPDMKTNTIKTALFSTIAGLIITAPIVLPAIANAAPRQATRIAQSTTPNTDRPVGAAFPRGNRKAADPARQAERAAKHQEMKAKIDAILTPAQRQQMQEAIGSGINPRLAMAQLNLTDSQKQQLAAALPKLAALNLTDAQKTQVTQITQKTRQQVQGILTPQQQEQLRSAIAQGKNPKEAMKALGISDTQKTQLRQVYQYSKDEFVAILTPEQRQQMGGEGRDGGKRGGRRTAKP